MSLTTAQFCFIRLWGGSGKKCENPLGSVSADLTKSFFIIIHTLQALMKIQDRKSGAQTPMNSSLPTNDHSVQSDQVPLLPLIPSVPRRASLHEKMLHAVGGDGVSTERWQVGAQREVYCQHCTWDRVRGTERGRQRRTRGLQRTLTSHASSGPDLLDAGQGTAQTPGRKQRTTIERASWRAKGPGRAVRPHSPLRPGLRGQRLCCSGQKGRLRPSSLALQSRGHV